MRLRTKILSSHAILALSVAVICVGMIFALRISDNNRRQLGASYEQLRNIDLIATEANHYIEQIAELIIIGPEAADLAEVRSTLSEGLALQRDLIRGEIDWLGDLTERNDEVAELELIDAIARTLGELDLMTARIASELRAGRRDIADALYRDEVENRLDDELDGLIVAVLARETHEVQETLSEAANLSRQSTWLALGIVLIVFILGIGNSIMLNRSVLRPVTTLADAADAVGRGDLSYIVAARTSDELGNLAQRFNHMTRQIREQRDALHRTNETLERQVAERTQELLARSEELEALNTRLRDIDAKRAQFFADISHELRTPLTVLRGQAEVALRRCDGTPAQTRETLEGVVRKVAQMGRLVEDMLFLARSEHGSVEMDMKPMVLQEMMGDVLLDSQTLARRKDIVLSPYQPFDPILVCGDAGRLRQAVVIVLDNAIKFSPAKSTVAISLSSKDEHAILRISDHGPGFSRSDAELAFLRFYRGNAGRDGIKQGAGLGLAIAKWIVDGHGGTIGIEDSKGGGATVIIRLPLATGSIKDMA